MTSGTVEYGLGIAKIQMARVSSCGPESKMKRKMQALQLC